jgi:cell wall-associated NlpC family hydrolase
MTAKRPRIRRLLAAALLVVPIGVSLSPAYGAPTEEEVEQAEARLEVLEHDLEVAIEAYNEAQYQLSLTQERLAEAKARKEAAEAEAEEARRLLSERAVLAYTGLGSQLDVLLGAQSITEFSDRLEFIGAVAQSDAELAARADAAAQRAQWAAQDFANAVAEAKALVAEMASKREEIEAMTEEQAELYQTLDRRFDAYQRRQAAAAAAAAAAEAAAAAAAEEGETPPPQSGGGDGGTDYVPPPNASAAEKAVAAAYSVLGTPYVWASANPAVGFDCSGLTMWAWAQAGVSIPHSSQAQYAVLPHVPLSAVQPGDLIFYYSPTSHVAIYVGGGTIIHARHPGPGGEVQTSSMYGYDTPYGAARPG